MQYIDLFDVDFESLWDSENDNLESREDRITVANVSSSSLRRLIMGGGHKRQIKKFWLKNP